MPEWIIPKNEKGRDLSPVEAATGVVLPVWAPRSVHLRRLKHMSRAIADYFAELGQRLIAQYAA